MDGLTQVPALNFEYDPDRDVLTIEGIKYSGHLFRGFGLETPVGQPVEIVRREDGNVVLRAVNLGVPTDVAARIIETAVELAHRRITHVEAIETFVSLLPN
jgi:hypothetical protein